MKRFQFYFAILITGTLLFSCSGKKQGKFELPAIISNNMVLQQNQEVALWGKALPGMNVTVEASWNVTSEIKTGKDSTWILHLKTPVAGGPYTLTFSSGDSSVVIENVMIGEVWICSGQSNMEMPLAGWPPTDTILHSKEEIASAQYPGLRMFTVEKVFSSIPENACKGNWQVCSEETAGMFSATAYFFGKILHQELGVPIGLIHSSWGGTPVESWMNREKLSTFEEFRQVILQLDSAGTKIDELEDWLEAHQEVKIDINASEPWANLSFSDEEIAKPTFNHEGWKTMILPVTFESSAIGQFDGAVWYRKFVTIPDRWKNKELVLELGPIDDMDITYFNGEKVGGFETEGNWQAIRKYNIPGKMVQSGENLLAVRVLDIRGGGGIYGKRDDLKIYPATNPNDQIALQGEWRYLPVAVLHKGNLVLLDIAGQEYYSMAKLPIELGPYTPTALYNAMIHPLVPYTLKGAIWYQGESNAGNPELYARLFPAMIEGWREVWKQGDFPFYFVQIAPFNYDSWANAAGLREAQFMTLKVNNTGMAVTLDIGNPMNIHPANKAEVGRRLALWALAKDYGKQLVYSGPLYASLEIKDDGIRVSFDHVDGGLKASDGGLKNFQIAGEDKVFHEAKAYIDGNIVIVKSPLVNKPVAVRYLWDNFSEASLFNGHGLPASSFRTDSW